MKIIGQVKIARASRWVQARLVWKLAPSLIPNGEKT